MMLAYRRRGKARVYWLTLPAPRSRSWSRIYRAVDRALVRARRSFRRGVRLVRIDGVFTPHWRFRVRMRWRGRSVVVRQADGIHLSPAGAGIAATLVVRGLRRDGVL
jgi:hypothetical protein